jgi:mannose/cellobiose epimerase-like protein (N-acyl-D-glucosamine 2-epimerase family)
VYYESKKTSPFRNLDRTHNLIEEVFTRENHQKEKLIFENPWSKKLILKL